MVYPSLLHYGSIKEYRSHYEGVYCRGPILTFDGIQVRFRKERFDHCFFESTLRNEKKDKFSNIRAERMDWIKTALQDASAELHIGWDRHRKGYDNKGRVTLVVQDYVVVIRLTGKLRADFVTAYIADSPNTIKRIKNSPPWQNPFK